MGYTLSKSQSNNSDFPLRFISAIIVMPIVLFLIFKGKFYLEGLSLVILAGLLREWSRLSMNIKHHFLSILGFFCTTLSLYTPYSFWIFSAFIIFSLIWTALEYSYKKIFFILGNFYIVGAVWQLVHLDNKLIMWVLLLVWFCDTGAYVCGRIIGGPKLFIKISPNKTWAGFLGGTLLSFTVSVYLAGPLAIKLPHMKLIALFLVILSHLGDLLESWSKRKFGVKDTGSILPGHGGLLDRLDSLLAVAIGLGVLRIIGIL